MSKNERTAVNVDEIAIDNLGDNDAEGDAMLETEESKADLKRVLSLAKPEVNILALATVALFFSSLANLAVPLILGRIIDTVTNAETVEEGMHSLRQACLELVGFFIFGAFFSAVRAALYTISGQRVVARLRNDLFTAIVNMEIGFFDESRTGELTNRLSSDTEIIQNAVTSNISMLLRHTVTVLLGMTILFVISWKLTLVMLAVVPPISFGTVWYGKFMKKLTKEVQAAQAAATEVAEESFSNVRTVRSFAQEENTSLHYAEKVDVAYQLAKKRAYGYGGYSGVVGLLANLCMAGVLYYGAVLVLNEEMTAGTLTSFILYTVTVAFSLGLISNLYGDFMKAVGASERVFELIDRVPKVNPRGGAQLTNVDGEVVLDNVGFSYPSRSDVTVLSGVDLELKPGKIVALVGTSGGGKSTIVHLIERFYDPVSGVITLDGTDIKTLDPAWLRRQMGLVSQEPVLFATSIRENISFGRRNATLDEIEQAARMANAHDFISEFPEGYDTLVGEKGVRLSGGQKQRVAIARAILMDPAILLLDEATSALDAESEHLVQEALDRLMEGRTVLIIAHRLSTVKEANEVAVIVHGRVTERGTHDELLARDGEYKKLVARQLQWDPNDKEAEELSALASTLEHSSDGEGDLPARTRTGNGVFRVQSDMPKGSGSGGAGAGGSENGVRRTTSDMGAAASRPSLL